MTMTPAELKPNLDEIRKLAKLTLGKWNVPGAAIGIVKDDAILMAEGFGYRDVKNKLEVTADTLFPIASLTKAFTAFSAGIAVDEGLLKLDTPIKEYYPAFRLYDPCATEKATLRDLLTHRTGLTRHDGMWYKSGWKREEIIERIAYLEPARDFRSLYQYSNLMFMAAGFLVGYQAQTSWEEFVQSRILNRLGMERTCFTIKALTSYSDYALPYALVKGTLYPIPYCPVEPVCPAGGINSSLREMLLWVKMHLNQGAIGKTRLISEDSLNEMYTPQVVQPEPSDYPELTQPCYGLGWSIRHFHGIRVINHNGVIDGFTSKIALVPEQKLGILILNNLNTSILPEVMAWSILERFMVQNPVDWNQRYQEKWNKRAQEKKQREEDRNKEKVKGTRPSHRLADHTGIYENPGYGKLEVILQGCGLMIKFHQIDFTLEHYHYDYFLMDNHIYDMTYKSQFLTGMKGDIAGVSIPFELGGPAIIFNKIK